MKKLIEQVEGEGMESLLGENVALFCANYIYAGKLTGVNTECVLLEDAGIVYETGPFTDKEWKDFQSLNQKKWYVQKGAIESFGAMK